MASLAELFVNIGADISDFQASMQDLQESMKGVSEKMGSMGESMTKAVTLPLAALGAVGMVAAASVAEGNGKIQASLGVTAEKAEQLGGIAQDMWKDAFGENLAEVNDSLITTAQNIQGLGDADLKEITEQAYVLKDVFGQEITETTRTASVMMKNFGIDGQNAMDILTVAFQKGGNFSDELLDTFREYAPHFSQMGMSAEDMLGVLVKGAESGAFALDKVGDAVKEFNLLSTSGSKEVNAAFTAIGLDAELMGAAIAGGGEAGERAFQATLAALATMQDPIAQTAAGVALFGTQWEDLQSTVVTTMAEGIGSIESVAGATKAAGDAMYDTVSGRATSAWREFQAALIPVGMILLDMADRFLPPLIAAIQKVAGWFGNLSPAIQTTIVVVMAIVAAIGPLLIIIGQVVAAISALMPVFAAVGGVISALVAGGLIPLILIIGSLIAIGVLLYKNWDEIKAWATKAWTAISAAVSTAVTFVVTFIKERFLAILEFWKGAWNLFVQVHVTAWNVISGFIKQVISTIVGIIKTFATNAVNAFTTLWTNAKNAFTEGLNAILNNVKTIFNNVVNFVLGLGKTFFNAGKGLIMQMKEGIENAAKAVMDSVKDIAGKVRDFLPFSPAKTGPLSDLDKLDFGGPIQDSILKGMPGVQSEMTKLLTMPDINANAGMTISPENKESSILNFERMFDGANINVNDEMDMIQIAREIYNMSNTRGRGAGIA